MAKHLLCVDDSVTMQKVVAITFEQSDYTVAAARTADDALAMAKQTKPDFVLADALLGDSKSGYDVCLALKSEAATRAVPVVIMCGSSQPYDEARGKSVGADGHVVKPWDTQAMLDKVGEIAGKVAQAGAAAPVGAGLANAAARLAATA